MEIKIPIILMEISKEHNDILIIFHLWNYIPLLFSGQGHFPSIKGVKGKHASKYENKIILISFFKIPYTLFFIFPLNNKITGPKII